MMQQLDKQTDLQQYDGLFGLIGYPISHSFSKKYFTQKFAQAGITNLCYETFPLEKIEHFPTLIEMYPNLRGLNVTIPYKQAVLPYLDQLNEGAEAIGAVNTIHLENGTLTGYNTDAFGFEQSLRTFLAENQAKPSSALVLGTGGAALAVKFVLKKLGIDYQTVSRSPGANQITYDEVSDSVIKENLLIINTTPLGMAPNIGSFPNIPYHCIGKGHLLYDLVYNPELTAFLSKGKNQGAAIMNGLSMLYGQAEQAWAIWNKNSNQLQ